MTIAPRTCCLDLDTFFVSVERLLDPRLEGQPVVVGASPGARGVVSACSYEVRAFGVRSGMAIREAVRLAPHAIFLPTRHNTYGSYAKRVKELLFRFTPEVQTASIDEFFLDMAGCERLWRGNQDEDDDATVLRVVRQMRQAIQDEIGLPASVGIGGSRQLAKMACVAAKPAGVRMVRAGEEMAFVRPLPVGRFPGIGPVAQQRLEASQIRTLGDLLSLPSGHLRARYKRLAASVTRAVLPQRRRALKRDRPAFREHDDPGQGTVGSISNERTFHADVGHPQAVHDQLRKLAERVSWRARQRDVRARTVTLKLRTSDFHTITRSLTGEPTHHEHDVHGRVTSLLERSWGPRSLPVRLLGVALSNFVGPERQLELPWGGVPERPPVGHAVDAVRDRFGYDAIRLGTVQEASHWLA